MAETLTLRYVKTASLCCCFFAIGLVYNVIGPTILELQCAQAVSYTDILSVLPARASGFAIGSLLVGVFHNYLNPILTIAVSLVIKGLCAIYIPWTNSLLTLLIVTFICTASGGIIDNTSNVLMLYMWGKEGQPYLQTLHFSYGFGALVAPLLASPFLSVGGATIKGPAGNVTSQQASHCDARNLSIYIPYTLMGVFCLCMALVFTYLSYFHAQTDEHSSRLKKMDDSVGGAKQLAFARRAVVLVAGLLVFSLLGFEIGMGTFITSFAVMSDHHLTTQVGAYMTSIYWATFTFFRLFAIAYIKRISIYLNITMELCILLMANIFLVPFGNSVEWCLWVGIALTGVGMSTMWASILGLIESHFPLTSGATSFLAICACFGEWFYPIFMGYAFETSPQLYLWTIFVCTVTCCIIFAILCLVLRTTAIPSESVPATKPLLSSPADYGSTTADNV